MTRKSMLLKLEKHLLILVRRKNNLHAELNRIDNLPLHKVNKANTDRWHTVFCKIQHLDNRIATKKTEIEILAKRRDKVRDIISESKSIFNSVFAPNVIAGGK